MGGEVLPIIPMSCLRAGGGWIFAHLEEPRDWRRSSNRPWPQRPVLQWLARRYLPKNMYIWSKMAPYFLGFHACKASYTGCAFLYF
ncbi:hypothetical protein Hanom_Chr03g00237461 [Helianthus anomalus]